MSVPGTWLHRGRKVRALRRTRQKAESEAAVWDGTGCANRAGGMRMLLTSCSYIPLELPLAAGLPAKRLFVLDGAEVDADGLLPGISAHMPGR